VDYVINHHYRGWFNPEVRLIRSLVDNICMRFGLIKFKSDLDGEERYVWDARRRRWVDDKGLEGWLLMRIFEKWDVWPVADIMNSNRIDATYAVSERAVKELNLWDYVVEWIEANNIAELPSITNYTPNDLLRIYDEEDKRKKGARG
jgi:hypothetical protein